MANLVLWRHLTISDFSAMHASASPHGRGGGARHISLGRNTARFPIEDFIDAGTKSIVTLPTAARSGRYDASSLTLNGNPARRAGEWIIADQFHHRHPALSTSAGFPTTYDPEDAPVVLLFKVGSEFHVRVASEKELLSIGPSLPPGMLDRTTGIAPASLSILEKFAISSSSLLERLAEVASATTESAFDPATTEDGRKRILKEVLRRQGQAAFRQKLIDAYDAKCAITRASVPWVLEAAHITPYRGPKTNHVTNGLLLRSDVHTLFDLGLISIEPMSREVRVSRKLTGSMYEPLAGQPLFSPKKSMTRPSQLALAEHYSQFEA
ncbi:MAG TPA: HNH endonuclease [Bauldia sp.]|nr:HNH endonuclease [Bauldia sp.]